MVYSDPYLSESTFRRPGEVGNQTVRTDGKLRQTLITGDMDCPIDESSILWIDDLDTTKAHDYVVTKVAPSLNVIQYAVRKVNVSHG